MSERFVFLCGRLIPRSQAWVPVDDAAFRHGEGVFETLRARGVRAFRIRGHLGRLRASGARIGWQLPWDEDELVEAVAVTLRANRLPESRVRLQASPGRAGLDRPEGPPRLLVEAERFVPVPEDLQARGVAVLVSPYRRDSRAAAAGAKTCSYVENLLAHRAARAAGCFESIVLDGAGKVCEAAMANLFIVRQGTLWTPPIGGGVLEGITRGVVMELARSCGLPVRAEPFDVRTLETSDEVFLTSTGIEILPIVRVEDRRIGDGRPGPVALELARAYRRLVDDELGPLAG